MPDRIDPTGTQLGATLPEELRVLDRELAAIRIEERPSFAPELERELARAWQARPARLSRSPAPRMRLLLAACLAALMLAGMVAPSARASVIRLVRTVLEAVPAIFAPAPAGEGADEGVPGAVTLPPEPPAQTSVTPSAPLTGQPEVGGEPFAFRAYTFPEILEPEQAKAVVASYYPLGLQKAGIGGSVKVWFWVRPDGVPESIQMREGTSYQSLNYAAMRAVRELRFRPATRGGTPVGTWVEFTVHFVPTATGGILELEPVRGGGAGNI
jgi:TonB family protein